VRIVRRGAVVAASATLGAVQRLRGREPGVAPGAFARVMAGDFYYDSSPAQRALGYRTGGVDAALAAAARVG
jgi:hypothetical protein